MRIPKNSLRMLPVVLLLAACGAPHPAPPLALLITVDSLRFDRLGVHGSRLDLSPRIDALARAGELFSASYAASSLTLPSQTALHSGRYPSRVGVLGNAGALPDGTPTLAGALASRGWTTRAVVSSYVLRAGSGLEAGFEVYDDSLPTPAVGSLPPERSAAATSDAALRELADCTREPSTPCFLWVHYHDPHGPYRAPGDLAAQRLEDERGAPDGRRLLPLRSDDLALGGIPAYQALDGQREVAFYRAAYDAEVAYVDEQVGRLLDGLEDLGLQRDAVVVFTADHGEALGERDYWFSHGEYLDDPLVRVPLFVRRPGGEPGVRKDLVSHVDLFPTLLALLTGERAAEDLPGRDLYAEGAERQPSRPFLAALGGATIPRFGLVRGNYKLILSRPDEDGEWLAELYRSTDERHNIADQHAELVERLVADLLALQAGR